MSRKFILKGDTTDHGGVVLDGIANSSFDGRELAYLGAPVFCALRAAGKSFGTLHFAGCVRAFVMAASSISAALA